MQMQCDAGNSTRNSNKHKFAIDCMYLSACIPHINRNFGWLFREIAEFRILTVTYPPIHTARLALICKIILGIIAAQLL